jgi:hypothetical protein
VLLGLIRPAAGRWVSPIFRKKFSGFWFLCLRIYLSPDKRRRFIARTHPHGPGWCSALRGAAAGRFAQPPVLPNRQKSKSAVPPPRLALVRCPVVDYTLIPFLQSQQDQQ